MQEEAAQALWRATAQRRTRALNLGCRLRPRRHLVGASALLRAEVLATAMAVLWLQSSTMQLPHT